MSTSWQIATIRGIPIRLHWLFFLLPLFYAITAGSIPAAMEAVVLICILFACVVLHELGHGIAAQHYGIRVREIMLWPLGGVAQLDDMPDQPLPELVIAIAGPAVNMAIAAILVIVTGFFRFPALQTGEYLWLWDRGEQFTTQLLQLNLLLVGFNLIPAFPMDGGRILRALLNWRMNRIRATRIAMWVGRAFAVLFALWGIATFNVILIVIAIFVFSGAGIEYRMLRWQELLKGLSAADIVHDSITMEFDESLASAHERANALSQTAYAVLAGQTLVGEVTDSDIARGLATLGPLAQLRDILAPARLVVSPDHSLLDLYEQLVARDPPYVWVTADGRFLGQITLNSLIQTFQKEPAT